MRPPRSVPIALLALLSLPSLAQTPEWSWARSGIGEEFDLANSVVTDAVGNVIAVGSFGSDDITFGAITLTNHTAGFGDLFVVKYDPAGSVLWARSLGGSFDDSAYDVATDALGNVYVSCGFYSPTIAVGTYTFTNAGNVGDILVVKYDPDGNVLWATREGGPALEIPHAIAVDDDGGIVVAGRFSSNTLVLGTITLAQLGSMDVFVVKYDSTGNVVWAKSAGGGSNDEAYALAIDGEGDVIVAGYFTQSAIFGSFSLFNPGLANIFLAQCDGATGTFEWAKAHATDGDERALAIALDGNDHVYAAGFFQGDSLVLGTTTLYSTAFDNGYVARFDDDGDAVWAQGLNGRSKAQGIAVANNAVYACGVFRDDTLNYGTDVLLLAGASDLFLLKSDLNGSPQWIAQQTADGESGESALAMTADAFGDLVVAGNFNSDLTSFGTAQLINSNGYDMFVIKTGDPDVGMGEDGSADQVVIVPNPSPGPFQLQGLSGDGQVEVLDVLGAVMHIQQVAQQERIGMDLPHLPSGVYYVRVLTDRQHVVKKLVLQRAQ